jgi:hypothetical protein
MDGRSDGLRPPCGQYDAVRSVFESVNVGADAKKRLRTDGGKRVRPFYSCGNCVVDRMGDPLSRSFEQPNNLGDGGLDASEDPLELWFGSTGA